MQALRTPGFLDVLHDGDRHAHLRWDPPGTWGNVAYRLNEQKHQSHLVEKATLTPALREALALRLPEETVDPAYPGERAMLAATRLLEVGEGALREALLERGVPVWTVGWHRVPELFRVAVTGGAAPVQLCGYQLDLDAVLGPGTPPGAGSAVPSGGAVGVLPGFTLLDRLLGALSDGRLSEDDVLLAEHIGRSGYRAHRAPLEERQREQAFLAELDADPALAREAFLESARWSWMSPTHQDQPVADADTAALVAALRAGEGPAAVEVRGIGRFVRQELPPVTLRFDGRVSAEGWLRSVSGLPEPQVGSLWLRPHVQYVCPMAFVEWRELRSQD